MPVQLDAAGHCLGSEGADQFRAETAGMMWVTYNSNCQIQDLLRQDGCIAWADSQQGSQQATSSRPTVVASPHATAKADLIQDTSTPASLKPPSPPPHPPPPVPPPACTQTVKQSGGLLLLGDSTDHAIVNSGCASLFQGVNPVLDTEMIHGRLHACTGSMQPGAKLKIAW